MPIRFTCPSCGDEVAVSRRHAGRRGRCPRCRGEVRVPAGPATGPPSDAGSVEPLLVDPDDAAAPPPPLSLGALAAHLRATPDEVVRWLEEGCPHARGPAGERLFDLDAVGAWLRERRAAAAAGPFAPLPEEQAGARRRELGLALAGVLGAAVLTAAALTGGLQNARAALLLFLAGAVLAHRLRKWTLVARTPGASIEGQPGQLLFLAAGVVGGTALLSPLLGARVDPLAGVLQIATAAALAAFGARRLSRALRRQADAGGAGEGGAGARDGASSTGSGG